MIQQVNLYQDALIQVSPRSVINTFFAGLIALTALLIGVTIYLVLESNKVEDNVQKIKQQLGEAKTRLQILQTQYPKQQINGLLKQELDRSQNNFNSLSQVINLLTDTTSDQTQGFSRYFSALARQSMSEVWLSNITINGQQRSLELKGSSYFPGKIPVLLQKLQGESVFQGKRFVKLSVSQTEETDKQIDFMVSTMTEKIERAKHD